MTTLAVCAILVAVAACCAAGFAAAAGGAAASLYQRHRVAIYVLFRLLISLHYNPGQNKSASSMLLSSDAMPGWRGAVAGYQRLVLATALTGNVLLGMWFPVPPGVVLLVQSTCIYLDAENRDICSSQLMTQPLTHRRLVLLADSLDILTLPFSALVPLPDTAGAEGPHADAEGCCYAVYFFLQALLGVLMPVLLAARTLAAQQAGAGQQAAAHHPAASLTGRLGQRVQRIDAAFQKAVDVCCRAVLTLPKFLAGWLLISLTWLAALFMFGQ